MKNPHIQKWEVLDSDYALNHPWYKVRRNTVRLPNGQVLDDYMVNGHPDVVIIFALTPKQELLAVRQYKHGAREILTEMPAGVIDTEQETPIDAAVRELREETGYSASTIHHLQTLRANPTKNTNRVHVFYTDQLNWEGEQILDESEQIEVIKIPFKEAQDWGLSGKITVPESLACLWLGLNHTKKP